MTERRSVATAEGQPTDDAAPSGVAPMEGLTAELGARLDREMARRRELEIELREAQQKLRWNEERLVDFVDNAPLGMQRIGSDGTILWANRAQLDLLGYTEEEYVGRSIADLHVDPGVIADVLARLSRGEPLSDREVRLRAKDGSFKHVLISSSAHFRDGQFAYSRCISRDISQRRSAEHLATMREEQLRIITDALPVLVTFVDTEQRYRFVSANFERWFGYDPSEVIGRRLDEVLGRAAYEVIRPHVEVALGGAPARYEAEVPYRGAGTRWVEASYLPQRGADGGVSGFVALVADISERKALEQIRARSAARAEKLLKITSAIAEAVSSEKVYEAIVDHVAEAVEASTAALWLVDEASEAVRLVRSLGYHEAARSRFTVVRLDAVTSFPALDCVRRGEPIWIASQAKLFEHYPHLRGVATAGRSYRVACLPLAVHGRVLGALGLTAEDAREPSDEERELLRIVASYASQALERLRLLDVERRLRTEASASAQRLGVLSRASRALSGSELAVEPRLQAFVREVAAALGSVISVTLLNDAGLLQVTAVQHPNPEAQDLLQRLAPRTPLQVGDGLTGSMVSTGQSVILSSINPELLAARAAPAYRAFLEEFPAYALLGAPLRARGQVIGTVTATRVRPGEAYTTEDLILLEELAERAAVAIENARLYEQALEARRAAEHLYRFAQTAVLAENIEAVYDAALSSIEAALGPRRAAILTFDADGVMRFRAWRGLSSTYRAAVEGHSPWSADVVAPQPMLVPDALAEPAMSAHAELFRHEGIAALAFVPLVARGRLLGKFMLYYDQPHAFTPREVETARAIANHLASVSGRFAAVSRLEETVRQNELFAGVLAHDLRNPLGAIMTAAQLLARREGSVSVERDARPLASCRRASA